MIAHPTLEQLGWSSKLEEDFAFHAEQGFTPGRIAIEHRSAYVVYTDHGEIWGQASGALRHSAREGEALPCVGDWVVLEERVQEARATIRAVLPRRSKFSRKMAGFDTVEQVVAANVDVVFLVNALNLDVNLRRIERYLTVGWASGANPVIVLSKADLCDDVVTVLEGVESIALGVPIHVVSTVTGQGMKGLKSYLSGHETAAVLGPSGVGKSTLINHLHGEEVQRVHDIRDDGKGRHTTTHRQLVLLPGGGIMLDTPGMRELQLWSGDNGLDDAFEDIAGLAAGCRFRDCAHAGEPGCAVVDAVEEGTLSRDRLVSYDKLQRELRHLEVKKDRRAAANERKKWRAITKDNRQRARNAPFSLH